MPAKPKGFLNAVYSRLHVVLLVVAAGVWASYWMSSQLEPIYQSQARFFMPAEFDGFSLRSEQPNFPSGPKLPSSNTEQQDSVLGIMRSAAFRIKIADALGNMDSTAHLNSEVLRKNVDVDVDKFNMTVVTAYDKHPQTAADIAGKYVSELQAMLRQKTEAEIGAKLELLLAKVAESKTQLALKEGERLSFLNQNEKLGEDGETERIAAQLSSFKDQSAELQAEQIKNLAQIEKLKSEFASRPEFVESTWVEEDNPRILDLKEDLANAEIELQEVLTRVTANHRDAIAATSKLELIKGELAAEKDKREKSRTFQLDNLKSSYEKQITEQELDGLRIQASIDANAKQLGLAQLAWDGLADFQSKLAIIDRDLSQMRGDLNELHNRQAEFELFQKRFEPGSSSPHNYLEITEFATASSAPWFPKQELITGIAIALSLLIGILLALLSTRLAEWRERAPW